MTWSSVAIAAVTGDAEYTPPSLAMPAFKLGQNYGYYGLELLPGIPVAGQKVIDILGRHDIVILQHWPPVSFLERLKKAGTKTILLWVDYESVPAKRYWREVQWPIWQMLGVMYPLRGTQTNRFNSTLVDAFEKDPAMWPEKPHSIHVDITHPAISRYFVELLGETVAKVGYRGIFDGFFFDNVMSRPYYGTASNAPPVTPESASLYSTAWVSLLRTVKSLGWEVWGNTGAKTPEYTMLNGKMDERFFIYEQNSVSAIQAIRESNRLATAAGNPNQILCLHVETYGGAEPWALDKDDEWTEIGRAIRSPMGLVTARTGKWLFRPGSFPFKPSVRKTLNGEVE